jgi:hypothetical protein
MPVQNDWISLINWFNCTPFSGGTEIRGDEEPKSRWIGMNHLGKSGGAGTKKKNKTALHHR